MTAAGTHLRLEAEADPTWRDRAACADVDPSLMFPDTTERTDLGKEEWGAARAVCESCASRAPCLVYAVTTRQDHGCWAGTTPEERKRIRRRRALARQDARDAS